MKEIKRLISTGFWNDDKVLNDFSPEDRYFMLYLLSNPYTTQLGVYHLPLKKAALEMGYNLETIRTLLDRFENKYRVIRFNESTSEVAIKNYLRHSIVRGGKPVIDCLEKDLKAIKDLSLVAYVFNSITDSKGINETVIEFINRHKDIKDINNDNDNDNDNERYVHESYHESLEIAENQQKIEIDESLTNRTTNRQKKEVIYYPNDEKLNQTFADYVAMRKQIKSPMTDRAVELAISKLEKLSGGDNDKAIAILEQSIMNSWKGLFELKETYNKPQQSLAEKWGIT